ncbi:MAG: dipeptidase [Erythrobacter sp.]|uniref:dipeptidase n=1 Tax=Erythrobacter sp. TaxID=1042 RepID=UPI002638EDE0|nr:dipeptidase [Erythrobacter sp.]MDJ0979775.1 dipeptidase [Erythrobacter sp.]
MMQHAVPRRISRSLWLAAFASFALSAPLCAQDTPEPDLAEQLGIEGPAPDPAMQAALAALDVAPVFDGHNDMPLQLRIRLDNTINAFDFNDTTEGKVPDPRGRPMHSDLTRLRKGRVGAQFWAVYVPATLPEPEAVKMTIEQIDVTKRLIARYPDDLAYVETAEGVEAAMAEGRIASVLALEGGHSIGSDLGVLRQMYALGVRYMTLTHMLNVPWADSATDDPVHGGLSDFGKDVVREMNRMGMIVDLSHVSEETMIDALEIARAPVIFSHSGAKAVNGHARNVPDSVLERLAANGGIVMVVALPGYLNEERRQWHSRWQAENARLAALNQGRPDLVEVGMEQWVAANPEPETMVSHMADHIDHIRAVAGVEAVGIGGDFDGMPSGPVGFEDVSGYPALFAELVRRGYSQAELEMIASRNVIRVMRAVEDHAATQRGAAPIETRIREAE